MFGEDKQPPVESKEQILARLPPRSMKMMYDEVFEKKVSLEEAALDVLKFYKRWNTLSVINSYVYLKGIQTTGSSSSIFKVNGKTFKNPDNSYTGIGTQIPDYIHSHIEHDSFVKFYIEAEKDMEERGKISNDTFAIVFK